MCLVLGIDPCPYRMGKSIGFPSHALRFVLFGMITSSDEILQRAQIASIESRGGL